MIDLVRDLRAVSEGPSDDRVRALERIISVDTIQAVLRRTGHARRHYKILPAWFVAWLVIGLGLFATDCYTLIFKRLQRFRKGATPSRGALGEARKGLGCAVLRHLAREVIRLRGQPDTPGCFYQGLRLMALDSFLLDLYDSPDNGRVFGYPKGRRGTGAFPQARVLALCETGTHVLWRYQIKPSRRGEIGMAPPLLRHVEAGMLVIWDRNLLSYRALQVIHARGGHVLGRLKKRVLGQPIQELADGTYLAKAYATPKDRRNDRDGITVRVIAYTLQDPGRPVKESDRVHRLMTTLLDVERYPAPELIVLYHERWEEELSIDEVKTHLKERPVLRSQTPAGVVQEIDGLLLAHYAVRAVMAEAAAAADVAPRSLSFTATLKVLRCRLAEVPAERAEHERWWHELLAEVGELQLEPRRDRINPRVVRRPGGFWPKKRRHHYRPPQPTMPFRDSIRLC